MTSEEVLAIAKVYTDKSIEGAGAQKGAPCEIESITAITGGHRVTFSWEDTQGTSHTSTMNVMDGTDGQDGSDGADGSDGTGITTIVFKETDANGNNVYTVNLTDNTSYDITCPKGPQGVQGNPGQNGTNGSDGVGIVSIEKTSASGLVDTYTITYTNSTTSTFTVTNGSNATVTVDSEMSDSSTNPVQNKIVKEYTDGLVGKITSTQATAISTLFEYEGGN